jgi:hypothetical protein
MDDVENRRPGARACPNSWYLAPPPCFTRSAPSPSTNPLENLLIEHPSMSVYLLPVAAASSSLRATLYRSAPPLIMEENLNGHRSPSPGPTVSAETTAEPSSHRVIHAKRKRRVRAQRHAQVATTATPATPATTPRELGVCCAADEHDKQSQNEEKDFWTGKKLLAKNQLQRGNLLPEAAGPKKRANREGNYRCLH